MSGVLSEDAVQRYRRDGVLFPIPALTPGEVERYREAFFDLERRLGGKPTAQQLSQTHLHFRWAYDLATHPRVLDAVEDVLGPDILVWTVSIFPKHGRDPAYVSWHQDGTYWALDTTQVATAWVALTDSTVENGCMRVVAGSHQRPILPHRETHAADNLLSRGQEVEVEVKEEDATDIVLNAGQMSLHHVNIIHGSNPNRSAGRRVGFAVRFTTPATRQQEGETQPAVLARGRDAYGHFELAGPPRGTIEEGVASQAESSRRLLAALSRTRGAY
jgi:non-heme Fe2+,alpha-ketoglutarate-dependent halogenase